MKLLLIIYLIYAISMPARFSYDREKEAWKEYHKTGGCAFEYCPEILQLRTVKETHGSYPPNYYERYSKEWWRAYFNYL